MRGLNDGLLNLLVFIFIILVCFQFGNPNTNPCAESPNFSHCSGFYSGSIRITLTVASQSAIIRYTLDSSDPTETSSIYTSPIEINSTTVLRARTYEAEFNPSKIISHSYILNQTFDIPMLSVITDPSNLWGERGIYTHFDSTGDEWERPATVEFFENDGSPGFFSDVGLRIHGGSSRVFAKKSFRYYFRSDYGQSNLHYQLFKPKEVHEFKRFVTSASFLDAPGNSAYGSGTLLREAVLHEIGRRIETDISLGIRPVALFLDGRPWGIYNAIERIDRHLVEINFGIKDPDIIENYSGAKEGTMARWNEMISFFECSDLSIPQNYEIAKSYIDIQNFTRYHIIEIYGGNMDWPDYNNFAFCGRNANDKWQWILWDLDNAFAYITANTFEIATDDTIRGTIILRKLLENEDYRIYFLNECADFFNTTLQPENVKAIIDSLAAIIRNDIVFEVNRWGGSIEEWENNVQFLKNFADHRLDRLWQYILWELDVEEKHLLTIEPPHGGKGKVRVNSIYIDQYPWQGYYFENIPIQLEAIPDSGYKVNGWNDPLLSSEKKVYLILKENFSIYPIFEPDTTNIKVIINEINYNSAPDFDPEDWVEFYNPSNQMLDLSSWHFKDDENAHDFEFPEQTRIEPFGFLILCRNQIAFHNLFPDITNYFGDFSCGLSGSGDLVRIYNSSYVLIDSVAYDDKSPWPILPDGNGPTLELIDYQFDNTVPGNWRASSGYGSPGMPNLNLPQDSSRPLKLKIIKGSQCHFSQAWDNAIDGDIQGWDGTVRAEGESCWAIFAFSNQDLKTIRKFRLKTDSGIGASEYWVREFKIEVSTSDLRPDNFTQLLTAEKRGGNWEEFPVVPIQVRYIKFIVIKPASGWRQIAEIEIWGEDSSLISAVEDPMLNPDPSILEFDNSDYGADDRNQFIISNFPNPFNDRTNINFKISAPNFVRIMIYNIMGGEIKTLVNEWKPMGSYQISWDGKDANGINLPSGLYILQIQSSEANQTKKIILMK